MKKKIRNLATAVAIAAASILPMKGLEAQMHGSAEYIHNAEKTENSYGRFLGFYNLPEGIGGFSFMELYKNGKGYFGKTYLDKSLVGRVGPRIEADHIGNPLSQIGVGVSTTIPGLPEGAFARVGVLPFWIGREGEKIVGNKTMLQYAFSVPITKGLNLRGFGDWDLSAEGGPQWSYGELETTVNLGEMLGIDALKRIKAGYNPVLLNDGDAVPQVEHRGIVGVRF